MSSATKQHPIRTLIPARLDRLRPGKRRQSQPGTLRASRQRIGRRATTRPRTAREMIAGTVIGILALRSNGMRPSD